MLSTLPNLAWKIVSPLEAVLASLLVGLIFRRFIFSKLHKIARRTEVREVTNDVAREVMMEVPGDVPEFNPFIRFHTFGDHSINFTVILRGKEFVDQFVIKHEFIKRLLERYRKEGIEIPFPIRTVHLHSKEKSKNDME